MGVPGLASIALWKPALSVHRFAHRGFARSCVHNHLVIHVIHTPTTSTSSFT